MPDASPTNPDPPPPDLTGRTVGDFRVLRKLGQGGMGQVYLARQLSLNRDVALKILRSDLADNPTALKRFQAEAEAVARVTHANIVQVYAVGEHAGVRYMALEFVAGRNLREYLARKGPPDLPVTLSILRQVAAALQRASELGLVHRDIKPENILVNRKAEVKVADFGLSRYFAGDGKPLNLTGSGMTLGTPLYMAPEQVQGHPVDHRTDLYALGVTAYQLLAGQPPFRGTTAFEVALQHVQADPPPLAAVRPDLPADVCGLVHKLMAKRAGDRYQSARDVIRDVARLQRGLALDPAAGPAVTGSIPVAVALPSGSVPVIIPSGGLVTTALYDPPPVSRWPRLVAGAACVALAAGGWWGYSLAHPRADSPTPATAGPGLPDIRPDQVISTRERELLARRESRAAKPAEVLSASVELGLLYIRERRWDEAEQVFKELEQERLGKGMIGRLGRGVVLAHRDRAKESAEAFDTALAGLPRSAAPALSRFLFDHPDFAQAVADALARDAEAISPARLPERLDWLRTPGGVVRGPKG